MIIGWKDSLLQGDLIHSNTYCLSVRFTNRSDQRVWQCMSVYDPNAKAHKMDYWQEIRLCKPSPQIQWIIYCDFKRSSRPWTRTLGNPTRMTSTRPKSFFVICLCSVPMKGHRFTWTTPNKTQCGSSSIDS